MQALKSQHGLTVVVISFTKMLMPFGSGLMAFRFVAKTNSWLATGARTFVERFGWEILVPFNGQGRCDLCFQKNEGEPFRKCTLEAGTKADEFWKIKALIA